MQSLAILSLLILGAPAAAAAVPAADAAWAKGDYRAAFAQAIEPAIKGDARAQFLIGEAYRLGRSVDPNFPLAEQWYGRAARQGDVAAATELGLLLTAQHMEKAAIPWLTIAAHKGEPRALCSLAAIYFNGDAVPRDAARAFALMSHAAAAGLPEAKARLATLRSLLPPDVQAAGQGLGAAALGPLALPPTEKVVTSDAKASPAVRNSVHVASIRIQVGAYRSAAAAEQAWAQLRGRIAGPLNVDHGVERAGTVYRLQARLTDYGAARDFRRRLTSAGWNHLTVQGNGAGHI